MAPALVPPALARRLLERVLRDDPAGPAILGDLHEDFVRIAGTRGAPAARRWYVREALVLAAGRIVTHPWRRLGSAASGPGLLSALLQDAAYAGRSLRRTPAYALFTAAVIGLGVGAATAVFSVLKPLAIAPLPFAEPERLVWIANEAPPELQSSRSDVTSRSGNLRDFRERASSFEGLTGYNAFFEQGAYALTGEGEPERLVGVGVAHDFVDVLGVRPLLGRSFTEAEGAWGAPGTVLLQHGFWVRRFAADPSVVGRTLTLNGAPYVVVGVLPPSFDFASLFAPGKRVDILTPFPISDETDRWGNMISMIGRLRPGVSPGAAQAELDALLAALQEEDPRRWGLGADLSSLREHVAGPYQPALALLAAAAGTLLLIVCVNVSNLVLARAPGRTRELAVRKALGASRGRLARQLLLETLGISLTGALLGVAIARGTTALVARGSALGIPLLDGVAVDGAALTFAVGVALITGLVVGLAPALQVTEGGEATVLRSGGRGVSASRASRRTRELLVFAEVTLACVLLVAGGLLVRSFRAVLDLDLGFEPAHTVAWQIDPHRDFRTAAEMDAYFVALTDRVGRVPGVEAVGLNDAVPLRNNRTWGFQVVGRTENEDVRYEFFPHIGDAGYHDAMRIELVAGRFLSTEDGPDTQPVVLLNEAGARRVFPGEDPIGRRIRLWDEREWEVVGVVGDVRQLGPEVEPGTQVYFSFRQQRDFGAPDLVVRSRRPAEEVAARVAAAIHEVDPALPTHEWWTMDALVDRAMATRGFTLGILTAFGAAALLLAGLGIYGVLAHSVAERRAEIGIRMALGASSSVVVRGVIGRSLVLAGAGVAAGSVLAFAGTRLMRSLLYGVGPTDPTTFTATAVVLLAMAALAGALPAMRAVRMTGARALRAE